MELNKGDNTVASIPTPDSGGTAGYFKNQGSGPPWTVIKADFLNGIAAELKKVINDIGGLTLDGADTTQLYQSLIALLALKTSTTTTGTVNTDHDRAVMAVTQSVASGDNSVVAGANYSTASGTNSLAAAAGFSTASGNQSAVVAGVTNTVSGDQSAAAGGNNNFVSGDNSVLLGSRYAELGDDYMVALGYGASSITASGANQNLKIALRAVDGQVICQLLKIEGLINYADNAAAVSGGLLTGDLYYTTAGGSSVVKIVT